MKVINPTNILPINFGVQLITADIMSGIVTSEYSTEIGRILVEVVSKYNRSEPCEIYKWGEEPSTKATDARRHNTDIDWYFRIGKSKSVTRSLIEAELIYCFSLASLRGLFGKNDYWYSASDKDAAAAMIPAYYKSFGGYGPCDLRKDLMRYMMHNTGMTFGAKANSARIEMLQENIGNLVKKYEGVQKDAIKFMEDTAKISRYTTPGGEYWTVLMAFALKHYEDRHGDIEKRNNTAFRKYLAIDGDQLFSAYMMIKGFMDPSLDLEKLDKKAEAKGENKDKTAGD